MQNYRSKQENRFLLGEPESHDPCRAIGDGGGGGGISVDSGPHLNDDVPVDSPLVDLFPVEDVETCVYKLDWDYHGNDDQVKGDLELSFIWTKPDGVDVRLYSLGAYARSVATGWDLDNHDPPIEEPITLPRVAHYNAGIEFNDGFDYVAARAESMTTVPLNDTNICGVGSMHEIEITVGQADTYREEGDRYSLEDWLALEVGFTTGWSFADIDGVQGTNSRICEYEGNGSFMVQFIGASEVPNRLDAEFPPNPNYDITIEKLQ